MNYRSFSDTELVEMIKADDQSAFKEIYIRYWKPLFTTAQRKVPTNEISEEILQNIFLTLWEKRHSLQVERLEAYLFGALKYQVIDQLRKQIRDRKYLNFAQMDAERFSETPDNLINAQDISVIFKQVFNRLPEKTSKIFHMSRVENKTIREIARSLQMPERTVEYHVTQSLKILRQELGDFLPLLVIFF